MVSPRVTHPPTRGDGIRCTVAHLFVNSRVMSCPFCRSGWSLSAQDGFMQQCQEQQVSVPQAAPSYNTRLVPPVDSLPPGPPDSIVAFSCAHNWASAPTECGWTTHKHTGQASFAGPACAGCEEACNNHSGVTGAYGRCRKRPVNGRGQADGRGEDAKPG